ncbi:MAG: hypothetical protein PHG66_02865 [Candidatus Colwellbacteria bacterium]|nr:hypothetical protein [Candidatus Colwellbacteria bacterium]
MKKILSISFRFAIIVFAVIGLLLTAGFFAVKWKLTDVKGVIDPEDRVFANLHSITGSSLGSEQGISISAISPKDACRLSVVMKVYPDIGDAVFKAIDQETPISVVSSMISAALVGIEKADPSVSGFISRCSDIPGYSTGKSSVAWMETEEWRVFEEAVKKDSLIITEVGRKTGVSPRLIVGELVGEQLRLFNSDREVFKQFFAPLKILGNETKFSLGVTGIKEETAIQIENNLKDRKSVYYLGPDYEEFLDFKTTDHDVERIERLTDKKNRYYPYLYTALFIKQIEKQWSSAGYNISDRPEIIGTLFNIGFKGSKPNADPKVGGALIVIGEGEYTFGSLVYDFYYSGRMIDEFPYVLR